MRSLTSLLTALADLTETEARPQAKATATLLRLADPSRSFPAQPPSTLDALILAAARCPDALSCARLLAQVPRHLPWQASPAAGRQPAALAATKAVVTLIGPDGPIQAPDLRFGLFYQAPGIHYPLHAHEAAETYWVLAGTAEWRAGDNQSQPKPGDAIHHPPQMPHAMRAGPLGFLAIWRWSGDIGFDSYQMLPDGEDQES